MCIRDRSYTEFDISDVDVQIGQDKKVHVHCNGAVSYTHLDVYKRQVHGGGMVLDWGVHLLDQILYLYGDRKIETVYACLLYTSRCV